ncbi:ATP-grasp domain-containing protein [Paractinoplanes rishiriensis]|nr:ATP-grasp domain-containing protein [Actinoplanes rishiriensis]
MGHEVFAVRHRGQPAAQPAQPFVDITHVDFGDVEAACDRIIDYARANALEGITTANEFLTPIVTRACAMLGFPGNDPGLATAPRSKIIMAERFRACGVPIPITFIVTKESEVEQLLRDSVLSMPVVVKPAENAGSKAVSIVEDPSQLAEAFDRVRTQDDAYGIPLDTRTIVQEYVEGEEFSVESITQDGTVHHLCITRKITTAGQFRVEIGHSIPARLPPNVSGAVLAEVSKAIKALGIRNSVSHSEVKLRPDGRCVVLEVAARIGAGRIAVLTELACGISIPAATVDLALGRSVNVTPTRQACATVRLLLSPRHGRLREVRNLPEPAKEVAQAALTRPVGAVVNGPETNGCRIGYFIVVGPDEATANRRADELLSHVEVVVEPSDDLQRV